MNATLCVKWADDHFGIGLMYIDPFLTKISAKKRFLHFLS